MLSAQHPSSEDRRRQRPGLHLSCAATCNVATYVAAATGQRSLQKSAHNVEILGVRKTKSYATTYATYVAATGNTQRGHNVTWHVAFMVHNVATTWWIRLPYVVATLWG